MSRRLKIITSVALYVTLILGLCTAVEAEVKPFNYQSIDPVPLLITPTGMGQTQQEVKLNAENKYQDAMVIVKDFFKEDGMTVSGDLNDINYQKQVISLGSIANIFDSDKQEILIDFVKFMDLYENYDMNKRIVQLNSKATEGSISLDEELELASYKTADNQYTKDSVELITEPGAVFSNGYNNIAARDYAYKWTSNTTKLRNNTKYPYYKNYYGCTSCWNDCTNFVSQAIKAGGMKDKKGAGYPGTHTMVWFYNNTKPSSSWGGAHNFYSHWKLRAGVASSVSALQTGDVVNADFGGDGHIDHAAIITRNTGSASNHKYLTQHTADKKELTTLKNWYNSGYKVYGYEMDKAKN